MKPTTRITVTTNSDGTVTVTWWRLVSGRWNLEGTDTCANDRASAVLAAMLPVSYVCSRTRPRPEVISALEDLATLTKGLLGV